MDLTPPVSLRLAHLPTPLEPLERLGTGFAIELWIKRDDLTGSALTGNKVRKLDFLVADALQRGADTLVTCGAVTSNHARATAVAAARMGLRSHLVLRGEDVDPPDGNLLLDRLVGADTTFITPDEWDDRDAIMARVAAEVDGEAYVIPEGGSNYVGAMGYALAARELVEQEEQFGLKLRTLVHATGSGGTTAGLALGFAAIGRDDVDVVGIAVCNDAPYFDGIVRKIVADTVAAGFATEDVARRARWRILDGYKGRGYALTTDEELELIAQVARTEGVVLDPVYTGKAFNGLLAEAREGRIGADGAVVFLHTGGIFGLFSFAADLSSREPEALP